MRQSTSRLALLIKPVFAAMSLLHQKLRRVLGLWRTHRYSFLFYTLCLTLIASPLLATIKLSQTLLFVFVAINLTTALWGLKNRQLSQLLLAGLFILMGVWLIADAIDLHAVVKLSTAMLIVFGFIACIDAVRVAMIASKVNGELLYAALSVYMLIGILFAMLHYVTALEWHDAYSLPEGETLTLHTGIYFSFVTQTTLGFGDVLPRSDLARGLTIIQGVAGQLYLTAMVARLVGLYASTPKTEDQRSLKKTD